VGPQLRAPDALVPARWPLVGRRVLLDQLVAAVGEPWPRGIVLHGPAGVGKTRLAAEVLDAVVAAGGSGTRVTATLAAAGVPLGALAPLLPPEVLDRRSDPVALYGQVAAALRGRSPDGPFLLVVDDAHRLDVSSMVLLGHLLDDGVVFLLATERTGEPVVGVLSELWRREHLDHREIGPLGEDDLDTLLHLTLGGPLDATTRAALWSYSQGNVLWVRELVTEAAASGALAARHGVWRLEGSLPRPRRLIDLLDARLDGLDERAAAAVDILATGAVSLDDLTGRAGFAALEALERAGLIEVRADGRRRPVTLTHPLYDELVRDRMPVVTRRRLLRQRADQIEAHGARRHDDALAIASARLDADGAADPDIVVRAARLARHAHDFAQVERLAGAALAHAVSPAAVLLLAEARAELGACAEVEELLVAHEDLTRTAPAAEALLLVALRVRNLVYGCQRPADATAINERARDRFGADHPELRANEATIALLTGDPRHALDLARAVPGTDWRSAALRAFVEERALVAAGAGEDAAELCDRAYLAQTEGAGPSARDTAGPSARDTAGPPARDTAGPPARDTAGRARWEETVAISHPGVHLIHRTYALTEVGRLDDARALAELGYEASLGEGPPAGQVWFGYHRGRVALLQGRAGAARRSLAEAAAVAGRWGYLSAHRLVLALLAMSDAWLGDAAGAREAADELHRLPDFAYLEPEQRLGPAWALVAAGDTAGARSVLAGAADDARAAGWRSSAAWILHDLARLGDPATATAGLDGLADVQGPLVAAYRLHAGALVAGSTPALTDAADRFTALGAALLAAEACTEAAARAEDSRTAAALRARAAALLEPGRRGPNAEPGGTLSTPALARPPVTDGLSAREREVAALAADRLTSREIAERLFLSVRTVDNHLQRIYAKLGVRGRTELTDALGPDATPPAGSGGPEPAG
jgi:DNA-binding CsgD family transcriptional regulator